jgi:hypothetical protein
VDLFIYPYLFNFECFLSLGAVTWKERHNLWVLGSTSELVNLTILAKKIYIYLLLEFLEAKSQREKKMYLKGALDSAYFHRMRKATIYQIDTTGKLCRYQIRTLSYIKTKRVMHQELRRQVKIHKIFEKLNTGINIYIFLPPPFFFFLINVKKQQRHA